MSKLSNISAALIVPAYNEASVIHDVIDQVKQVFIESGLQFEIIVVDDGSDDNTAIKAQGPHVKVIRHILNVGSGGATATGLSYAQQNKFTLAATLDADGQHDPQDVLEGIKLIIKEGGDLLIGSRLINNEGMSRVKLLGNRGLSFITYMLFGIKVTDSQSGLRIFSKRALDNLRWKTSGYEYCSEMLWRAKQQGMNIREYPIKTIYTDYSKAKGQSNWNAFNILRSLLERRILEIFGE